MKKTLVLLASVAGVAFTASAFAQGAPDMRHEGMAPGHDRMERHEEHKEKMEHRKEERMKRKEHRHERHEHKEEMKHDGEHH